MTTRPLDFENDIEPAWAGAAADATSATPAATASAARTVR
jgi:hypothetical protein